MDLTDKIDLYKLEDSLILGVEGYNYQDGLKDCLIYITPKVAIDFANWITTSEYENPLEINEEIYWRYFQCDNNYTSTKTLFEEFLKDYKYD